MARPPVLPGYCQTPSPYLSHGIEDVSNGPAATDQDVPSGPKPTPPTAYISINYEYLPLLSDRPTTVSEHISTIPLWYTPPTQRPRP